MATAKNVLVVFGTRPEAIKLFPVIASLRMQGTLRVRVCVTGQHRDMLDQVLTFARIVPDIDLDVMTDGQSLDSLGAALLTRLGEVFASEAPDRIIVQGDTATAYFAALAAHHHGIPVSHVEAGLRSGDLRHPCPEEAYRRMISVVADQHFAPTRAAADMLRAEGIDPASIHETGNTVIDALLATRERLLTEPALASGLDAIATQFAGRRIIAVTTHRRENCTSMRNIAIALCKIAARDDVAIVLPVHPNPLIRAVIAEVCASIANIATIPPLDYSHFVRLLGMAHLVLTDSGGVQEEAPALGKPVLVMRETTERPEGIAAGTARLVGTDPTRIVAETFRLLDDPAAYAEMAQAHSPYGDGKAADRIAGLIALACET